MDGLLTVKVKTHTPSQLQITVRSGVNGPDRLNGSSKIPALTRLFGGGVI